MKIEERKEPVYSLADGEKVSELTILNVEDAGTLTEISIREGCLVAIGQVAAGKSNCVMLPSEIIPLIMKALRDQI